MAKKKSPKSEFFGFRAEPELAAALGRKAAKLDLNKSQILRKACAEFVGNANFLDAHRFSNDLDDFRRNFAPVGSNLNQLAKLFNEVRVVDEAGLSRTHEELREQFRKIMKILKELDAELQQRYT